VQVAIADVVQPQDLRRPGHMNPLRARDGGVLVRAGHTEAAVDVARLAGLYPAGVICEIMNDDGTMARRPDLIRFAQFHALKIGTIADLIAYRRRYDRIVERELETTLMSRFGGEFRMYVYVNRIAHAEHVALVKGDLSGEDPVLVRVHALNVLDDVLGDQSGGRGGELHAAMAMIAEAGRGVVLLIREALPTSLSDRVRARLNQETAPTRELRDYGVGAQILLDLGVKDMVLVSNTRRTIIGLEGYGLRVVDQRPIPASG
jgi:3,4-dihydroxy 2-butanone 4-phosphate synthase/GTP cyclohydrolase II